MIARRNFNQNFRRSTIRNVRGPAPRVSLQSGGLHDGNAPRAIGSILSLVLDKYGVDLQTANVQTVVVPAVSPSNRLQQRRLF